MILARTNNDENGQTDFFSRVCEGHAAAAIDALSSAVYIYGADRKLGIESHKCITGYSWYYL